MDALLRGKAEELAKEIAVSISTQQELGDVMRLMTKSVIEHMLDAEMDVHLDQERGCTVPAVVATTIAMPTATTGASAAEADADRAGKSSGRNRRNGKSAKTVQGESGRLTLTTPRDRNGTFEPLLIPKHERRLAGFDDKVLALYAKGMSTRDIQELLKTLYGVELSATLISSLTDAVDEEVTAWRSRPLEAVWPIVYFDGIVVYVRGTSGPGQQGGGARFEEHLSGGDPARSGASPGKFRSSVAGEVSDNRENVAVKMDRHHHAVRLSGADPQGDFDDQRDRIGEQRNPKVHQEPQDLSE